MINLHPNYIEKNGKKEYAVIPYEEFLEIQEQLADFEDLKLLREAKSKEADASTTSFSDVKSELGLHY